jgi:hypothetical protein
MSGSNGGAGDSGVEREIDAALSELVRLGYAIMHELPGGAIYYEITENGMSTWLRIIGRLN